MKEVYGMYREPSSAYFVSITLEQSYFTLTNEVRRFIEILPKDAVKTEAQRRFSDLLCKVKSKDQTQAQ